MWLPLILTRKRRALCFRIRSSVRLDSFRAGDKQVKGQIYKFIYINQVRVRQRKITSRQGVKILWQKSCRNEYLVRTFRY